MSNPFKKKQPCGCPKNKVPPRRAASSSLPCASERTTATVKEELIPVPTVVRQLSVHRQETPRSAQDKPKVTSKVSTAPHIADPQRNITSLPANKTKSDTVNITPVQKVDKVKEIKPVITPVPPTKQISNIPTRKMEQNTDTKPKATLSRSHPNTQMEKSLVPTLSRQTKSDIRPVNDEDDAAQKKVPFTSNINKNNTKSKPNANKTNTQPVNDGDDSAQKMVPFTSNLNKNNAKSKLTENKTKGKVVCCKTKKLQQNSEVKDVDTCACEKENGTVQLNLDLRNYCSDTALTVKQKDARTIELTFKPQENIPFQCPPQCPSMKVKETEEVETSITELNEPSPPKYISSDTNKVEATRRSTKKDDTFKDLPDNSIDISKSKNIPLVTQSEYKYNQDDSVHTAKAVEANKGQTASLKDLPRSSIQAPVKKDKSGRTSKIPQPIHVTEPSIVPLEEKQKEEELIKSEVLEPTTEPQSELSVPESAPKSKQSSISLHSKLSVSESTLQSKDDDDKKIASIRQSKLPVIKAKSLPKQDLKDKKPSTTKQCKLSAKLRRKKDDKDKISVKERPCSLQDTKEHFWPQQNISDSESKARKSTLLSAEGALPSKQVTRERQGSLQTTRRASLPHQNTDDTESVKSQKSKLSSLKETAQPKQNIIIASEKRSKLPVTKTTSLPQQNITNVKPVTPRSSNVSIITSGKQSTGTLHIQPDGKLSTGNISKTLQSESQLQVKQPCIYKLQQHLPSKWSKCCRKKSSVTPMGNKYEKKYKEKKVKEIESKSSKQSNREKRKRWKICRRKKQRDESIKSQEYQFLPDERSQRTLKETESRGSKQSNKSRLSFALPPEESVESLVSVSTRQSYKSQPEQKPSVIRKASVSSKHSIKSEQYQPVRINHEARDAKICGLFFLFVVALLIFILSTEIHS